MKQIEWLRPEQWGQLDIYKKAATLNAVGAVLREIYDHPNPPLLIVEMKDSNLRGTYGNGYTFNNRTGLIEGADYGIKMNIELFGPDPSVALKTYIHEFRHSYQAEQTLRLQKPQFINLVEDPDEAQAWQHKYIYPTENYDGYLQQPVEKDARDFADKLVKQVYG